MLQNGSCKRRRRPKSVDFCKIYYKIAFSYSWLNGSWSKNGPGEAKILILALTHSLTHIYFSKINKTGWRYFFLNILPPYSACGLYPLTLSTTMWPFCHLLGKINAMGKFFFPGHCVCIQNGRPLWKTQMYRREECSTSFLHLMNTRASWLWQFRLVEALDKLPLVSTMPMIGSSL